MIQFNELKILIVDDEVSILELLRYLFSSRGAKVTIAQDGKSALSLLEKHEFDVVISDFRMPRLNGISLLESMGQVIKNKKPAVILLSGYQYLQNEQALDKGASALLNKPLEHDRLLELARRYATPQNERWRPVLDDRTPKDSLELDFHDIHDAMAQGKFLLGKGGFFISVAKPILEPGAIIGLNLRFGKSGLPAIEGVGEVRWVRDHDSATAHQGYGIEIIWLAEGSREHYAKLVDDEGSESFIPFGVKAPRAA